MARRIKRDADEKPPADAVQEPAPEASGGVSVFILKATHLYNRKVPAGELVKVPKDIAALLRAKGLAK